MKALVIGTGGREHALAWKIAQSPSCSHTFLHPGNSGTLKDGLPNFDGVPGNDLDAIITRARQEQISLVVIGPEALLEKGWSDAFRREGFAVCGPAKESAQLETSKIFAKQFMAKAGIPTADFAIAESAQELKAAIEYQSHWPTVIKLDGLAAGKGVCVAQNQSEALDFADRIYQKQDFGSHPHRVLLEQFLPGREVSYIVVTDGKSFVPMATATDYKRIGDGDRGANTGGMGCISPSPYMTPELESRIQSQVVLPALEQLKGKTYLLEESCTAV